MSKSKIWARLQDGRKMSFQMDDNASDYAYQDIVLAVQQEQGRMVQTILYLVKSNTAPEPAHVQ